MSIGEDLRAFLLADQAIADLVGEACAQQRNPQEDAVTTRLGASIVFRRSSTDNDTTRCIDDTGTPVQFSESWDVEAASEDAGTVMQLAELLKLKDSHLGAFGAGRVQGIFVRDQNDRYMPISVGTDAARHWAAVEFEIIGYEAGS